MPFWLYQPGVFLGAAAHDPVGEVGGTAVFALLPCRGGSGCHAWSAACCLVSFSQVAQ